MHYALQAMESVTCPAVSDVYQVSMLLGIRAGVGKDERGEPVIKLQEIPAEVWQQYGNKVSATRAHRRSPSKLRQNGAAATQNSRVADAGHVTMHADASTLKAPAFVTSAMCADVTEILTMNGDALQQWIHSSLQAGKKSELEAATGAHVSEKKGVKGRGYLVVSGAHLAVEQAL